jgi:hypothetical protein
VTLGWTVAPAGFCASTCGNGASCADSCTTVNPQPIAQSRMSIRFITGDTDEYLMNMSNRPGVALSTLERAAGTFGISL